MSPNRIVAFLTPLLFAPAAGALAAWLARHFPGVQVSQGDLEQIFIAGAAIALAPALQWLHGWQKWEARNDETQLAVQLANAKAADNAVPDDGTADAGDLASEADDLDLDIGDGDDLGALEAYLGYDEDEDVGEEQPASTGR